MPWIHWRRQRACPQSGRRNMLDNLRRSLSAPAALFVLLASWSIVFAPRGVWLGFILSSLALASLLSIFSGLMPRNHGVSGRHHLRAIADDVLVGCGHAAVALTLLAHNAYLSLDAIVRTFLRMPFSKRHLLEWVTA